MNKNCFYLLFFFVLIFASTSFASGKTEFSQENPFVVVLDAGHGGHDPGNLGNGYLEKNIALNIVLQVGAILEKNPNIKVIYTRNDDTFVDLYVRGEIANKANANLFVSVHCDSHTSEAHGAGTFVLGLHANKQNFEIAKKENSAIYLEDNYETRYAEYNINSPESVIGLTIMQEEFLDQSILLAKTMQDNFTGQLKRKDRQVKQAGFIVLHQTFMPSVLVETGFLTYKPEGQYLNSVKGQKEMGTAIATAILDYKKNLTSNTSNSTPITKPKETVVVKEVKPVVKEVVKAPEEVIVKEKTPVVVKEDKPIIKEVIKPNVLFKIQILATSQNWSVTSNNFKGLKNISKESYKTFFRYLYSETESFNSAKKLKEDANAKGYKDAYIVAYKNGERITIKEALKYESN
ncbi:N-acetylmuramoyl-L-alanine amidase [Cellulophaga sp. HaHaR_3_176]|uniref:N-acetylmuramoyl-L-alanine amidase family protein n=1 Tax=Cellulophaga sp. HaHaR_3_176 TaxID=1942464 RepID=UPI001C1F67CD|nr:N-acetylmuramoyl-L-alanine amidase [Cellulophaga sp. HaHaR_3_176]QWX84781.1 N-acetylmuramoyl-L-alanine amidase [Cellulophaga sp. HaHaR_3_176]